MKRLTLNDIWKLALEFVPAVACEESRLTGPGWWGPAHEIAHALVATPADRRRNYFGLKCHAGFCSCRGKRCHVLELAAMDISRRLVTAAGHPKIADQELGATLDYNLMRHRGTLRSVRRLLARLRLRRVPRTANGLRRMLAGRMAES